MKRTYEKDVRAQAYQHGGERRTFGKAVKTSVIWARTGAKSLNLTINIGNERRHVVCIELDAHILRAAASAIPEPAALSVD